MPYGNKGLHFGHIGGVFVHADAFARFLRDRIGAQNVIFVSGTDCYGSPIAEDHRLHVERGDFDGSLQDFVTFNHDRQKRTLEAYAVSPNLFAASSLDPFREIHEGIGAYILQTLRANGHLDKLTTPQFYDAEAGTFLNGRQVLGKCPVEGCRSEKAYADECALGHQYEPKELIDPRSSISGNRPEMRDVTNWYVPLEHFRQAVESWLGQIGTAGTWRQFVVRSLLEYFEPPTIHVTRDQLEALAEVSGSLPPHDQQEGRAKSVKLVFDRLEVMEQAKAVLAEHSIRYRTGKTLVPFRLTGNLEWGLKAPELDGVSGVTFWVWPESLWAPVSFTAAYLAQRGESADDWRTWWCEKDAQAYQFIGEDNVFFYGLAELGMWLGTQGEDFSVDPPAGQLQMPHIIANKHVLFLDKKASSSGKVKPPMASELLDYYTCDQLRAHFLSMGLGMRNASFRPKPLDPKAAATAGDPVLKEGNLLSNALNRAVRSCFYTAQKFFDSHVPVGPVTDDVLAQSNETILAFEQAMYDHEFHVAVDTAGRYIRDINKRWSRAKAFVDDCAPALRTQTLIDAFHMVRVAVGLMHPVAPIGTEMVRRYLGFGEEFWKWETIFEPIYAFMADPETHRLEFLQPRVDFFEKHPSQVPADQ